MDISRLAKKNKYKYPGYDLINHIKVASPIYRVPLDIVIQKKKKLGVIQEFCLRLIKENIKDTNTISQLLGIDKDVIDNNVSELIGYDIVKYTVASGMSITEKGKVVAKNLELEIPVSMNYTFNVDGLTGEIFVDDKKLDTYRHIQKEDVKSINVLKNSPTLDSIGFKEVRNAIRKYNSNFNKLSDDLEGDLVHINDMDKSYIQYKYINLLVFHREEDNDIKIMPFEKNTFLENYKDLISIDLVKQIILEKKEEEIPKPIIANMDKALIESVDNCVEEYKEIEEQLIANKEKEEAILLEEKNNNSEEELKILRERISLLEQEISKLSKNRVIHTYEHRDLLMRALTKAEKFAIIISPWIRRSAFDKELEDTIYQAVKRKIRVIIGYGISDENDACDKDIIKRLKKLSKENENFELVNLPSVAYDTHEKVLICDREFMVITSFNWLSFRGNPNWGLRQETGYYVEQRNSIDEMIDNINARMNLNIV